LGGGGGGRGAWEVTFLIVPAVCGVLYIVQYASSPTTGTDLQGTKKRNYMSHQILPHIVMYHVLILHCSFKMSLDDKKRVMNSNKIVRFLKIKYIIQSTSPLTIK
jgi:hypothetical protein